MVEKETIKKDFSFLFKHKDVHELQEYFYFVNKFWEDQKHRQRITKKELAGMLG